MRVLIVDDDRTVLEDNREYFEKMGYETVCADTSGAAEEIINSAALDCVILDIDLPDGNGFELCARVRERTGLPIVFLSGYTEEQSRIRGFSIGGDDYVCKPYSLEELELRVRARIKSGQNAQPPGPLQYGDLMRHPGEVFSYEQIYNQVWKAPINKGIKSLQVIIGRIRQKLLELCPGHEYIQTVRRKGYLFVP